MTSELNGILPVYKPRGMVSKDVSRVLTRNLGKIRLGHAGTLDPMAEGVLPIMLGSATRYQDFLIAMPKAYEFDVELGYETTTLDAEGDVVKHMPVPDIDAQLPEVTRFFVGARQQVPPVHSAVKIDGKPLYQYARTGKDIPVPVEKLARNVNIYELKLLRRDGPRLTYWVRCSKGTYVRVLAQEIAQALGTCGTVTRLVRTQSGGIPIEQTVSIEACSRSAEEIRPLLVSPDSLDLPVPRARCSSDEVFRKLKNGLPVALDGVWFFPENTAFNAASEAPGEEPVALAKFPVSDVLLFTGTTAFGIGSVFRDECGRSLVRMRRGL